MEPPLIRDIMRAAIAQESDVEIVGEFSDPIDALVAIGEHQADVLIHTWSDSEQTQALCSHIFAEHSNLLVIEIKSGEEFGYAHRQIVNMDGLLSLIRSARSVSALV